jgi:hypothetical protein
MGQKRLFRIWPGMWINVTEDVNRAEALIAASPFEAISSFVRPLAAVKRLIRGRNFVALLVLA